MLVIDKQLRIMGIVGNLTSLRIESKSCVIVIIDRDIPMIDGSVYRDIIIRRIATFNV
jgi:hypothetical protein